MGKDYSAAADSYWGSRPYAREGESDSKCGGFVRDLSCVGCRGAGLLYIEIRLPEVCTLPAGPRG